MALATLGRRRIASRVPRRRAGADRVGHCRLRPVGPGSRYVVGATGAGESGPGRDVHGGTDGEVAKGRGRRMARGARLGRARILWGWLVGVVGPVLLA
ncbi:hypothetical protein, partial [Streptomyces griseus]|uniref:hypothetical protein n=1 Tax=Streptomyces griseus TaxID=1911 RepID=UPI00214CF1A9